MAQTIDENLWEQVIVKQGKASMPLPVFQKIKSYALSMETKQKRDPVFSWDKTFSGEVPKDVSKNHDKYIYS